MSITEEQTTIGMFSWCISLWYLKPCTGLLKLCSTLIQLYFVSSTTIPVHGSMFSHNSLLLLISNFSTNNAMILLSCPCSSTLNLPIPINPAKNYPKKRNPHLLCPNKCVLAWLHSPLIHFLGFLQLHLFIIFLHLYSFFLMKGPYLECRGVLATCYSIRSYLLW